MAHAGSRKVSQAKTFVTIHPEMHSKRQSAISVFNTSFNDRIIRPWCTVEFCTTIMAYICVGGVVTKDFCHNRTSCATKTRVARWVSRKLRGQALYLIQWIIEDRLPTRINDITDILNRPDDIVYILRIPNCNAYITKRHTQFGVEFE